MTSVCPYYHRVLFLCTGNLYRSRFAEILFNNLVADTQLDWEAFSRGVSAPDKADAIAPISPETIRGLQVRGIEVGNSPRYPIQLSESDFADAHLVIALNGPEHRPYLEKHFSRWVDCTHYWRIEDFDSTPPDEAMASIEGQVRVLVQHLVDLATFTTEQRWRGLTEYARPSTKLGLTCFRYTKTGSPALFVKVRESENLVFCWHACQHTRSCTDFCCPDRKARTAGNGFPAA